MIDFKYNGLLGMNAIRDFTAKSDDEMLCKKGEKIAELLSLKKVGGKYKTGYGNKTEKGLYLSVLTMIHYIESEIN